MNRPEYEIIRFDASIAADEGWTPSGAYCYDYCTGNCQNVTSQCNWVCVSEDCPYEED